MRKMLIRIFLLLSLFGPSQILAADKVQKLNGVLLMPLDFTNVGLPATASPLDSETFVLRGTITNKVITWNVLTNLLAGMFGNGSGEANTASTLGTGWPLTFNKVGLDIRFNSITNNSTLTSSSNSNTLTFSIANNGVGDAQLRQAVAVSIIGRSGNSTGNMADIAAASNGTVLKRTNDVLQFAKVDLGADLSGTVLPTLNFPALTGDVSNSAGSLSTTISAGAVTFVKMQNIATDRLLGRDTPSSGSPEELTVSGGLEFTGSGGIQRSALSGDVAASAGSGTTTVQNGVVTTAKLADNAVNGAKLSPILVSTNNQEIFNPTWLGTSTNVVIDQLLNEYVWVPSANCRFQFGTNLSGTNVTALMHVNIYATSTFQVTNVVDTWTPKGNWGALKVGWNELEILFKNGTNFISQDTAQMDATQVADGSVSNAEFQTLDGVTSSIQTQLNGKQVGPLTGDATTGSAGSAAVTLASTAVSAGTYGDSTHVGQFTVDAKGRLTAASNVGIAGATGLDIDVYGSSTNATTNAVWTAALPASMSAEVSLWGAGVGPTNYFFGHRWSGSYTRVGSANPVLIDSTRDFYRSSTTPNAYFDVSGTNMVLICNAITNETFNWHLKGLLTLITNGGTVAASYNPATDSSAVEWLKADFTSPPSNGSTFGTWTANTGNNATQATGGNQPTYRTSQQNGLPGVDFTASNSRYMATTTFGTLSQAYTVWIVCKFAGADGNYHYAFDGIGSGNRAAFLIDPTPAGKYELYAGSLVESSTAVDTSWHIFECKFNGSSSTLTIDSGSPQTLSAGTDSFIGITLGAEYDGILGGSVIIGEVIVQDSTRTATSVAVDSYLNGRWATH